MVLHHVLGPKVLIFFSTACPSFLHGLFLTWMCMVFRLLWWMRTRRDLVCQPYGAIGVMSTSKRSLGKATWHC